MSKSSYSYTEVDVSVEEKIEQLERPYRNPEILQVLYHDQELSLRECAEKLDTTAGTVLRWMEIYRIPRRDPNQRNPYASFAFDSDDRPRWVATVGDGSTTTVYVSQLTAIAEGAEPSEVFSEHNHIHHRNLHPFDNRGENLEVVTVTQHNHTHNQEVWHYDEKLECPVLQTVD